MTELKPLIMTTKDFSTKLYFYYPDTEELFMLKNNNNTMTPPYQNEIYYLLKI